jgi:hypothetical protein
MNCVELIDFLGKKPTLLVAGNSSNKTRFGGMLSILVFFLLILGSAYFLNILFSRQNYTVVDSEEFNSTQFMDFSDFQVSMAVGDSFGMPLEDEDRVYGVMGMWYTYVPKFNMTTGKITMETLYHPIYMEKCNLEKHFPNSTDLWKEEQNIDKSYCMIPGQMANISKNVGSPNYKQMNFWFYKCQNNSLIGKIDCLPQDQIDQKFDNNFLALRFKNYYFDHTNVVSPAQPYIHMEAISISSFLFKQMLIQMKNVDYFSDEAYLSVNPTLTTYNIFKSQKETADKRIENRVPGAFTLIAFNMGFLKQSINRKYYKVQNMLADLGGLLKALITIAFNINLYFSDKTFYNKIIDANINSLYIKSIKKSLLLEFVGGEGKKRGSTYPVSAMADQKDEKNKNETFNIDSEKGSPKKFMNNKTFVSEIGQPSERVPVRDDMTLKSELRNSYTKNVELSKCSETEKPKENQLNNLPNTVQLKRNSSVTYNAFKIDFAGYLFPQFCFKKNSRIDRQLQLHSKFSKIINEQLDILTVTKKFHIIDKINYVISGDKYKTLLDTTINPYLYQGDIPPSSDIFEAREDIIKSFKITNN